MDDFPPLSPQLLFRVDAIKAIIDFQRSIRGQHARISSASYEISLLEFTDSLEATIKKGLIALSTTDQALEALGEESQPRGADEDVYTLEDLSLTIPATLQKVIVDLGELVRRVLRDDGALYREPVEDALFATHAAFADFAKIMNCPIKSLDKLETEMENSTPGIE